MGRLPSTPSVMRAESGCHRKTEVELCLQSQIPAGSLGRGESVLCVVDPCPFSFFSLSQEPTSAIGEACPLEDLLTVDIAALEVRF